MRERARSENSLLIAGDSRSPRLLVSVRSRDEAIAAIDGGADVIDVKEPTRGSLGMATSGVIAAVAQQVVGAQDIPLSVALGEVIDWRERADVPALPESVTFAKLGMSQLTQHSGWRGEWLRVRAGFDRGRSARLDWVAVAYADVEQSASPPILDILEAAVATKCVGLLIDTFTKTGLTLTECCTTAALCDLAERCHAAGLFLALAGRLARESLPKLSGIPADVLAIRSAACEDADRTATVSTRAVASFHHAMQASAAFPCLI